MKLSELMGRIKGLDIDVGYGDSIHVNYRVHMMTEATIDRITELQSEENGDSAVKRAMELVSTLVDSWDLTDDSAAPISLDAETLVTDMSLDVANFILGAISDDMSVPEAKSAS